MPMKKVIALFLLFIFLISNTGMAITIHFCGGKVSSISIVSTNKDRCKCGKKAMKKNCCKEKTTVLKIKDDVVKTNSSIVKVATQQLFLNITKQLVFSNTSPTNYTTLSFYRPPPLQPNTPLYLLDRAFLI
jgi:hypothetical protein